MNPTEKLRTYKGFVIEKVVEGYAVYPKEGSHAESITVQTLKKAKDLINEFWKIAMPQIADNLVKRFFETQERKGEK